MPWQDNNSGGPWGGGNDDDGGSGGRQKPRGQRGGGGGGGQPPNIEDFLRRGQERLRQSLPGDGQGRPLWLLIFVALIALWLVGSMVYRVNADEVAVIQRFGQYVRDEQPGLHFKLPAPIETVQTPQLQRVNEIDNWGGRTIFRLTPAEPVELLLNFHGGRSQGDARQNQARGTRPSPVLPDRYGVNSLNYADTDNNPFAGAYDLVANEYLELFGSSFTAHVDFGWAELTSLTGYEQNNRSFLDNTDASPSYLVNVNLNTDAKNCGKCGMVCPMNMPACVGGKCDGTNGKVLVIAPHSQRPQDLQDTATLLRGTGAFTVVDTFDAQVAAPTVAQLSAYGAVLIFAESGVFVDPVTFGDNLATYFDNGGRVVVAVMNTGSMPQGRFFTVGNGYILLNQSKLQGALGDPLGKIHEPMSPLLVDVKTFANSDAYTTSPVANGGIVVAESAAKVPMIVRGVFKGRNRVDINFVAAPKYWTGDGAALLRNALTY